jgi:MacB-like periplasmic core domain
LLNGLGVRFAAGRDFAIGEPAVVVTRGFALARFGSAAAAIGEALVVDRQAVTIVGVLADSPVLPRAGVDLFTPHPSADSVDPGRSGRNTYVIVRLADGVAPGIAVEQARAVAAAIPARRADERQPELTPLREVTRGGLALPMALLFAAAATLFVIAVATVSSLVLARAAGWTSEAAVRLSLGASRWPRRPVRPC